jgi:hypothetical protein
LTGIVKIQLFNLFVKQKIVATAYNKRRNDARSFEMDYRTRSMVLLTIWYQMFATAPLLIVRKRNLIKSVCSSVRPPKYHSLLESAGSHTRTQAYGSQPPKAQSTSFRSASFRAPDIWSLLALAFAHYGIADALCDSHFMVRKTTALRR